MVTRRDGPILPGFLVDSSRTKEDGIEYTSVAYLSYYRARIRGHGKIPQDDCADFPAIKPLRSSTPLEERWATFLKMQTTFVTNAELGNLGLRSTARD